MDVLIVGSEAAPMVHGDAFGLRQVPNSASAIGHLGTQRVDVVVARRGMTDLDSRQFLTQVRTEWPTVVRVRELAHGEQVDLDDEPSHAVVRCEFDGPELEQALLRAAELRARLDQRLTASIVKGFGGLPSAPAAWAELSRQLSHPLTASVPAIAGVIEQDVALTAQVLRQANSAFLTRGQRVTTVPDAVVRLGFQTLQQLVLAAETSRLFARALSCGVSVEAMSEEGLQRGVLAASLVTRRADRGAAFVAGMMLEVGQLVTACFLPDQTRRVRALARDRGWTLHEAEAVTWGVTHADIGAHLLEAWNLPPEAVVAASEHHAVLERGGPIDAALAARVARVAIPSSDPVDAVAPLVGWDDVVDVASAMRSLTAPSPASA